jgi:hypothetical protein
MPVANGGGAEVLADDLFDALVAGTDFSIPSPDLSGSEYQIPAPSGDLVSIPTKISNQDLTTKSLTGTGTFDILMAALRVHLQKEFDNNRITGEEYAKAYVALVNNTMASAVSFLVQKDAAHWQAITAQQQALAAQAAVATAHVQLETAKVQLLMMRTQTKLEEANFALSKMKLATEDQGYQAAKYQTEIMLPAQFALIKEQTETARSQTLDTRSDGTTVIKGTMGQQKQLYGQQITSYKRDAELKAAKIFSDAWITMKTIDEGLLPPEGFTNDSLNAILTSLKTNNGIG